MIEKLIPVDLPPGFFHNGTRYESRGRWYDGNLVRWHQGALQPVGGWTSFKASTGAGSAMAALSGRPTAIMAHQPTTGNSWVVVGTTAGLFAMYPDLSSTSWTNITPVGYTTNISWQLDVFGDLLVAYSYGSGYDVYTWDGNSANDGVAVASSPTQILGGVIVTPERFMFVLGASNNNRKVQWPDQETTSTWTPTATNQAGDIELQTQGTLLGGARVKGQTLLFTTYDVWSATYIGGEFIYSFRQEGDACGLIGPHAVAVADSRAYWMGPSGFYIYDGVVRPLPCDVFDKVFGEIKASGQAGIGPGCTAHAWANTAFDEIWWFYGTGANSLGNDRYVKYNYRTGAWDYGTLGRNCAFNFPYLASPILADTSGNVYSHEIANLRTGQTTYVESGPFEIADADLVYRIQRIVPDELTNGQTRMSVYTSIWPDESETTNGPYTMTRPTDVRLTARFARVKIEEVSAAAWRVGKPKFGIIPLGRR